VLDHSTIDTTASELDDALIALRRDIHRWPELAGGERRTARLVVDHLRRAGLTVTTGVGGHGVVAVLAGADDGPTVAFRADMDAVEDHELFDGDFASQVPGVAHLCGHDLHTSIGVGVAHVLARHQDRLRGRVLFLFQPAEETLSGAAADMLRSDGPLARFVFVQSSQHVTGQHAELQVWVKAWPDERYPALPDEVSQLVAAAGGRVEFPTPPFPAMVCSPELSEAAAAYLRGTLGEDAVDVLRAAFPFNGEDFALFLQQVPGAMFYLGVANPATGMNGIPHSPDFAADERAIGTGVRAMAGFLASRLAARPSDSSGPCQLSIRFDIFGC
jgi:metal-dependent amidase/aminoacylase/carboxypeptidase family protein